jgi:hypothetical protein
MSLEPIQRRGYAQPDRAEVECQVASAVEANPDFFIARYISDPRSFSGRYVAADLFKEMFHQYAKSKDSRNRYNTPVHNAAAVLSAEQFRRMLLAGPASPERNTVIFLTGIPGAGKTSSILSGGELPDHYRVVFEGQLSNLLTTSEKLQQALTARLKPTILVVHALPENALENTIMRYYEEGRGASIGVMSDIQGKLPETLAKIKELFSADVDLVIQDVRNRQNQQTHFGWENLSIISSEGNHEDIKRRLTIAIESLNASGVLSESCYQQAIGGIPISRDQEVAGDYQQKYDAYVGGRGVPQGDREEPVLDGNNVSDESEICERCKKNPCECGSYGQSSVPRPRVRP